MDSRELHAQVKRMQRMAAEAELSPQRAAGMIQPFIDKHKAIRLTMQPREEGTVVGRHVRHAEIVAAALAAGHEVQRARLKGLAFHNGYQKSLAARAEGFGYRGFVECGAIYQGEEGFGHAEEVWGRVDVGWARGRDAEVIFEIDSTVKAASLWKLQQARVAHKYWIYFGKDVWRFKTFLKKHDAAGEVSGVVLPRAWKP